MSQVQPGLFDPSLMREQGPSRHEVGWVYTKADATNALIAKVGYTTKPLAERLKETGQPNLVLFSAYLLRERAREAEGLVFAGIRIPALPHLMSGWESEWLRADPWTVDRQVAAALQSAQVLQGPIDTLTWRPNYIFERVKGVLGNQIYSDFWTTYFRAEGADWMRDVAQLMRPWQLPPLRR